MSAENQSMADYEEVLRVFPESVRKVWKDNPDVVQYLTDLSSVGLQRLCQEPERLAEERTAILEQTQDLAFHNYKTFIQTAECSHGIFQDFNIIESRVESLLEKLPKFSEKCQEFGLEAHEINNRWHQASLTLSKHPQLLEFLEMPQLMDTYVRNGYYEEALELTAYVKRLEKKHSSIAIISSIVKEVLSTWRLMVSQLLMQLRTNIQLPACLKIIGYLRRMDVFSECELRIKFLQARDSWFQSVLRDISEDDAYHHILKVIENSRIHLFDIITQYRAIFSDDDPASLITRDSNQNNVGVFQSWVALKISQFLNTLEADVNKDLGGRIDSVLAQCMYFGLSFSRVGTDFRPLLIPIFEKAIFQKFASAINAASLNFAENMQSYTITNYSVTSSVSANLTSDNVLQPPYSLLDFYPLAIYCNDVLIAFNELKLCAPVSLVSDTISVLEQSLESVVATTADFYAAEKSSLTDMEHERFQKFCLEFSQELIPHIEKCVGHLFPSSDITKILGVTPSEFVKMGNLCSLNKESILQPIESIFPSKEDFDDVGIVMTLGQKEPEPAVAIGN